LTAAKEAGVIFGPLMALIFIPFYAISLILSDPTAPIVQVFTYFPLSAPVTAMLRNGFGTLGTGEAIFIIATLFILGILILRLAVHLFRYDPSNTPASSTSPRPSAAGQPNSPAIREGTYPMTAGRWLHVAIASTILVVSVVMALQGSSGLWFTAVAMALAVISVLWRSRKGSAKTPTSPQRH